ncbi:MAG: hypothetical protein A2571_02420 [Candidatus Vogelbacteria bacterium RIFOXYD1_FULL_44_32]|uniref:Uncharacterized protein n=1 Tax=Candidatus Vogelbacteria bacterium RIFOXYD1_FULL_44_32 TaxID=1802438 RepID=A0A1G2QF39_9BACT|nr:MAG: hypothetical protein A2571_02420 [Candidatus Vogelbacteria bacterium RIFOXYD1_FULL_44_32]
MLKSKINFLFNYLLVAVLLILSIIYEIIGHSQPVPRWLENPNINIPLALLIFFTIIYSLALFSDIQFDKLSYKLSMVFCWLSFVGSFLSILIINSSEFGGGFLAIFVVWPFIGFSVLISLICLLWGLFTAEKIGENIPTYAGIPKGAKAILVLDVWFFIFSLIMALSMMTYSFRYGIELYPLLIFVSIIFSLIISIITIIGIVKRKKWSQFTQIIYLLLLIILSINVGIISLIIVSIVCFILLIYILTSGDFKNLPNN